MSEALFTTGLLCAAWLASVAGMGWLALSMPAHARQVWENVPSLASVRWFRWIGVAGIAAALGLCLAADHASMAILVWVMALTSACLLIAFILAWRPRWLRLLAPWV